MPVDGSSAPTLIDGRGLRSGQSLRPKDDEGPGFPPGDLLASRYRIVSLLGRGGMGEVYRVEDLRLGQTVALKFLPESLASDGAALARFHREVSLARQVSHPNVCRVFDVGEARGRPFLSMEHIGGEDLAVLLRRIGRLPADKAVELALQLCGGLAAIHDAGVLHRDLKPSNVMIDARGRARITDFGVAALAGELRPGETRAGTLPYMAPEQAARGEVSVQSDLYSLGLVLYEMFTGQRPFDLPRPVNAVRSPMRAKPVAPSHLLTDIHPLAESAILRCLEQDPRDRPSSAMAVARALPGGDPLAAALAAGETPSPEMVAAAAKKGSLKPAVAGACLAGVLLALSGIFLVSGKVMAFRQVPFPHSPEILADRASNLLVSLGYPDVPVDRAYGFELHRSYHESLRAGGRSGRLEGDPPLYLFWYRQSPGRLARTGLVVRPEEPPRTPGEAYVALTPEGRLYRLTIVPDGRPAPAAPQAPPDWPALLRAAGLEPARLASIPSFRPPSVFADARAAWRLRASGSTRIQAAAYRGRPVSFETVEPWHAPAAPLLSLLPAPDLSRVLLFFIIVAFVTAVPLARRNLRLGRGDRKGARRLLLVGVSAVLIVWLCGGRHFLDFEEVVGLAQAAAFALALGMLLWYAYIALEPALRRRWPERIISWSRLLSGGARDPLVGRDLLVGALSGVTIALVVYLRDLLSSSLKGVPALRLIYVESLRGFPGLLSQISTTLVGMIVMSFSFALLFLLLHILLSKESWALAGSALFFGPYILFLAGSHIPIWLALISVGLILACQLFVWVRFGLLADMASRLTFELIVRCPLNPDLSTWYSGATLFAVLAVTGLALYGFVTATAGRPWLREEVLEG